MIIAIKYIDRARLFQRKIYARRNTKVLLGSNRLNINLVFG
jgi:hypothetical protein